MSSRLIIHPHRACLGALALVALAHATSGCGGGTAKPPADTQAADAPAAPPTPPLRRPRSSLRCPRPCAPPWPSPSPATSTRW